MGKYESKLFDEIYECISNCLDREELVDLHDMIAIETGKFVEIHEMSDFDDVFENSSPSDVAFVLCNSPKFDIYEDYFIEDDEIVESSDDPMEWIDCMELAKSVYDAYMDSDPYPWYECEALRRIFKAGNDKVHDRLTA